MKYVYKSPCGYAEVLDKELDLSISAFEGYELIETTETPELFKLKRRIGNKWVSEVSQSKKLKGKELKESRVSSLLITSSAGNVFNGDELSQNRILKTLTVMGLTGQSKNMWKLANNSIVEVSKEELEEVLILAHAEMDSIWTELSES